MALASAASAGARCSGRRCLAPVRARDANRLVGLVHPRARMVVMRRADLRARLRGLEVAERIDG